MTQAQRAPYPNIAYQQKLELFDLQLSLKRRGEFGEAILIRKMMMGEEVTINPFHILWIELTNYPFVKQEFELIGETGAIVNAYIPLNYEQYL